VQYNVEVINVPETNIELSLHKKKVGVTMKYVVAIIKNEEVKAAIRGLIWGIGAGIGKLVVDKVNESSEENSSHEEDPCEDECTEEYKEAYLEWSKQYKAYLDLPAWQRLFTAAPPIPGKDLGNNAQNKQNNKKNKKGDDDAKR
tara:strand:- start:1683 stop:2114 length:432 start_codon:yes stop_codon:yes gene_type:complete